MAMDEGHHVYVTARSPGSGSESVTVKYDPAGEKLSEARTDSIGPMSIGVDSEGNVHVAGGRGDRVLVKYDSDGTELWRSLSLGAAFVALEVDPSGYVITNNHVVDQATDIKVTLSNGTEYPAKLVGTDAKTDIAVLKIKASTPLPAAVTKSSYSPLGNVTGAICPFGLTVPRGVAPAIPTPDRSRYRSSAGRPVPACSARICVASAAVGAGGFWMTTGTTSPPISISTNW